MKNKVFTSRFFSAVLLPVLLLVCSNAQLLDLQPAAPPFLPNQCECGAVSFDVDIVHSTPTKKAGNTQMYESKAETVPVSSTSTANSGKDTPQKIAPKNLPAAKKGDKVGIALSNFKAECPCMNGREKAGECFAYPLPKGAITTTSLTEYLKTITDLQKAMNDLQKKIDDLGAKIQDLKQKLGQTTSVAEKKKIEQDIKKQEAELKKLQGQMEKLKAQLPAGPPSVLDEKFQHAKGEWDAKGNYNAGQFDVTKTPFQYEFIIGYICVSQACGKPTVCYKKFVVTF